MPNNLYSTDYEQCVLGTMLSENSIIDTVVTMVQSNYFYNPTYQLIYERICDIYKKNHTVNQMILIQQCKEINPVTLAGLTDNIASSANIEFYCNQLKDFYVARLLQKMFDENSGTVNNTNAAETIVKIDEALTSLINKTNARTMETAKSLCNSYCEVLKESVNFKGKYLGIETGLSNLDTILDGLPLGELTIIGARPSIGKTSLAVNLATNIAMKKTGIGIFSLEMSNIELMHRMVAQDTGISSYRIKHGCAIGNNELAKINNALSRFYDSEMYFFDSASGYGNITSIVSRIRYLSKVGVKVFFIDHLGLIQHSDNKLKRYEQIGDITMTLHKLAQNLNISICVLCQLKRDAEGKKPNLSDLRESGDIEQNADVCMFLHRERSQGNEDSIPTDLLIVKNRNGECGTAKLRFLPKLTKFEDEPVQKEF